MSLAADTEIDGNTALKKSKKPLLLGFILALLGAAGGFVTTQMGFLDSFVTSNNNAPAPSEAKSNPIITEEVEFVALDPFTISLPPGSDKQLLRLIINLDVAPTNAAAVNTLRPRIRDILNTYLRALTIQDLEEPTSLLRLRTHMLHRVEVITGGGIVRDLLITEFVLN